MKKRNALFATMLLTSALLVAALPFSYETGKDARLADAGAVPVNMTAPGLLFSSGADGLILDEGQVPLGEPLFSGLVGRHIAALGYDVPQYRYMKAVPYVMQLLGADSDADLYQPVRNGQLCFLDFAKLLRVGKTPLPV